MKRIIGKLIKSKGYLNLALKARIRVTWRIKAGKIKIKRRKDEKNKMTLKDWATRRRSCTSSSHWNLVLWQETKENDI